MTRDYGECPLCGEHCWLDVIDGKEPNLIGTHSHRKTNTDYGPGEDWKEDWRCPKCDNQFLENNGFP